MKQYHSFHLYVRVDLIKHHEDYPSWFWSTLYHKLPEHTVESVRSTVRDLIQCDYLCHAHCQYVLGKEL